MKTPTNKTSPAPFVVSTPTPAGVSGFILDLDLGEALGGLGRLAIPHPDHPEMIGVPVHPEFELAAADLRSRFNERIRFHRHV